MLRLNRFWLFTLASSFLLVVLTGAPSAGQADGDAADREYADGMAREHANDDAHASPAAQKPAAAAVVGDSVAYASLDGSQVSGYLARPADSSGRLPAVLVIHEWWGLNDNIRSMARQLAAEGYTALAVDLYEGHSATDRAGALALMQGSMSQRERLEENLRQAHDYLRTQVKATKVGSIGWCFGGGWSLGTALLLPGKLDATVIYYGRLVSDRAQLASLETPVLGLFGSLDQGIPVSSVREFETAMQELEKSAEIHVYEGANHAFANPSGNRYDAPAAEDAWRRTLAFLAEHLQ